MPKKSKSKGPFEKVGSCLYRYKASGVYYARIKKNGKEIRQSLETTDREAAKATLTDRLVEELGEWMEPDATADAAKVPGWRGNILVDR